jgi:hypothetical protein
VGVITAILALAAAFAVPAAMADGDPASDVLVESRLFDPADLVVPQQQQQLLATLAASARSGFPLRVALIASQGDLGTATSLWNKPGEYARYLGTELSQLYHGQVLVVMPDGFGLYGPSTGANQVSAKEAAVRAPSPGQGARLAASALAAAPLLAAAAGHPIATADIHVAVVPTTGATSVLPLIALIVGALLIVVAWVLSLRARPLEFRRRVST